MTGLSTAAAKLAALALPAKAAVGAATAAAAIAAATATGSPATTAVQDSKPVEVSVQDAAEEATRGKSAEHRQDEAAKSEHEGDSEHGGTPAPQASFGQSVAAEARDGGVDGQEISERAKARNEERKTSRTSGRPADAGSKAENAGRPPRG